MTHVKRILYTSKTYIVYDVIHRMHVHMHAWLALPAYAPLIVIATLVSQLWPFV